MCQISRILSRVARHRLHLLIRSPRGERSLALVQVSDSRIHSLAVSVNKVLALVDEGLAQ